MTNLIEPFRNRPRRPWFSLLGLTTACAVVLLASPRDVHRLVLLSGGVSREIRSAWARWIARRAGVTILTRGNPREPAVALTFDDGPHPHTCAALLNVLRDQGARATFFAVGCRLRQHPELLDRMVAEGHEVGNHTWDHQRLTAISLDKARREVRNVRTFVFERTGFAPRLVRPPGGTYDARVLEMCRDEGFAVCLWTVNAGDWKRMPVEEIVEKVLAQVRPGSIVLMHDEFMQTPRALPRIIRALRARGYRFVTASEMLGAPPPAYRRPVPGPHWNLARIP